MSDALRLADALEQQFPIGTAQHHLDGEAAAELRRLHQSEREGWRWADELEQERKRLHALNAELVEALRWYVDTDEVSEMEGNEFWLDGRDRARAALAKATTQGESK